MKGHLMCNIRIAFATDEKYVQHMGCVIASILINATEDETFSFYILDGGITPLSKQKIESLSQLHACNIIFIPVDLDTLEKCPVISYYSLNTYLRLLLPDLLPDIDKILYLDCDMIVTSSLSDLWNAELGDASIGVVEEYVEIFSQEYQSETWHVKIPCIQQICQFAYKTILPSDKARLGLNALSFNAGMLLINLKKIRRQGLFHETIKWIEKHSSELVFADQDALNILFQNDLKKLPIKWNIQYQLCWDHIYVLKDWHKKKCFNNILDNPVGIIHYVSAAKPWHSFYKSKLGDEYWKYLAYTPWKDYIAPDSKELNAVRFRNTNKIYGLIKSLVLEITKHFV